jgi:hypothetical protein
MYVIREILNCKPGKVRQVVESFRLISATLVEMGRPRMRLMTDVSAEPFWTLVAEMEVEQVDQSFELEREVMKKESVQKGMAAFREAIIGGRREIYRVE